MTPRGVPHFAPLDRQHDQAAFACGVPALDRFLTQQARQEMQRYVSATYVLLVDATTIAGYYTLSNNVASLARLPVEVAKRLPRYPDVPATLIARLAVDQRYRGQHYGRDLLVDAVRRSYSTAHVIGSAFIVVDAKDDDAVRFYGKYGFLPFQDMPYQLFLPMATAQALVR